MKRFTMVLAAVALSGLALAGCNQATEPGPTLAAAVPALTIISGDPGDFPPDGWIYQPAELPSGFTKYECTFGFGNGVTLNDDTACQEKQWGQSGIYREQIRNMHTASSPDCHGGPADFDTIRLCNMAWEAGSTTPFGAPVGGKHCAIAKVESRCVA